jgi:hypothetical protein
MTQNYNQLDWQGMYAQQWKGAISPAAFRHPAKYARALIFAIYEHAAQEGWLHAGDRVIDPFGGVALGGMPAVYGGYHWTGCELEERFVAAGQENIALWEQQSRLFPVRGTARLLHGDSRNMTSVLSAVRCNQANSMGDLAVSSPPYVTQTLNPSDADRPEAKVERLEREGKFEIAKIIRTHGSGANSVLRNEKYGDANGQLIVMPEGDFAAAISSPPYGHPATGISKEEMERKQSLVNKGRIDRGEIKGGKGVSGRMGASIFAPEGYGTTEGNLGNMDSRDFYPSTVSASRSDDTFWSASRAILDQVFAVLRPGGHAIFVTKDFVRNGRREPFSDMWSELCRSAGFQDACQHRAWLVKYHSEQPSLLGGETKVIKTERKSFFKLLWESKGSPRIDWEDVTCWRRP